jgi:hypothetical protein
MHTPFRSAALVAVAVAVSGSRALPRTQEPNQVTIVARDYGFDAPDTLPAGATTIRLKNQGPDLHHVVLVRLDSGRTVEDLQVAFALPNTPLPPWITFLGGPQAPVPGGEATATIALTPGRYLLACIVHSPALYSGMLVSHVEWGMVKPLTVIPSTRSAVLPRPDATIALTDYAFGISHPLTAGRHVIRITNTAEQPHELLFVRLNPGKAIADLPAWVESRKGPPPVVPIGGMTPLSSGGQANVVIDLPAGRYGLICFLPDADDGKPHFGHGMMREITVEAATQQASRAK